MSISHHLWIFMPETCEKIYTLISENKMPEKSLFDRK
jgi:hypothetical protein